jgi:class 3 adenylate cyclase
MDDPSTSALLSYLPIDRLHALAAGRDLPAEVRGAAVEADLSGFTALTESLARRLGEHHGAEELARRLDVLFGGLVAAVHGHRGAVLSFSGDAMTCWFDSDDGRRAVAAALRMQAWIDHCQDDEAPVRLKVAVAVGATRRFLVGDPERQLLEGLAGALVDELAATEHTAEPGEIVLSPSALASLGSAVTSEPKQGVGVLRSLEVSVELTPWPPLPSFLGDETVRPWLLPAVYERLRAGQGDFLAELRPAVAVFVRFIGIDFQNDPDALAGLDGFVRRVQTILGRYEGTLVQLTIGDKGSYLYAAFGAPIAHEDDISRAVSAAAEVSALADEHVPEISVGVTAGRFRAGAYGGVERRTYGVLGDAVNLSARLMQAAAAGEVIATHEVADRAGEGFGWRELAPLTVKGKSEPVAVRALEGVRSGATRRTQSHAMPLLGRDDELHLLRERLAHARSGSGQIVGIAAEAGMGKSRPRPRAARGPGSAPVRGRVPELRRRRQLRGVAPGVDLDPRRRGRGRGQTPEQLDPALAARLPLLSPVLGIPIDDNDLTRPFDAKLRKTSLEAMLVDVLRAVADVPLVIVLDDIHWIDPLSEDLLLAVARAVHALPVLVLLAYRARSETEGGPPAVAGLPHFTELALTELANDDVEQLVRLRLEQVGGSAAAVEAVAERVTKRAQGNPFYIEELLTYLTEGGGDLPSVEELERLELPGSLHSLILSRMDRLEETPRATLKVASAVGRSFEAPVLPAVHPSSAVTRRSRRASRTCAGTSSWWSRVRRFAPTSSATSSPRRLRTAASPARRGRRCTGGSDASSRHGRATRSSVSSTCSPTTSGSATTKSGSVPTSFEPVPPRRPGTRTRRRSRTTAACFRCSRATSAPMSSSSSARRSSSGAVGRSRRRRTSPASRSRRSSVRGQRRAWFETSLAELARKQGQYDEARERLTRARADFDQAADQAGAGQVLHYAGTLAAQQGDYPLARSSYEQSLELRRSLGDRHNMASILSNLGIVAEYEEAYDDARRFNEEALACGRSSTTAGRWRSR